MHRWQFLKTLAFSTLVMSACSPPRSPSTSTGQRVLLIGAGIPQPEAWQITRWSADPFARGSYSFNALGATPEMRDHLAQPVDVRRFFAGEATNRQYFGTVHSAYLSGMRAAKELLAIGT